MISDGLLTSTEVCVLLPPDVLCGECGLLHAGGGHLPALLAVVRPARHGIVAVLLTAGTAVAHMAVQAQSCKYTKAVV